MAANERDYRRAPDYDSLTGDRDMPKREWSDLDDLLHELYCLVSTYALMDEYPNERERCEREILATAESIKDMHGVEDKYMSLRLWSLYDIGINRSVYNDACRLGLMRELFDYYVANYYEPPEPVDRG